MVFHVCGGRTRFRIHKSLRKRSREPTAVPCMMALLHLNSFKSLIRLRPHSRRKGSVGYCCGHSGSHSSEVGAPLVLTFLDLRVGVVFPDYLEAKATLTALPGKLPVRARPPPKWSRGGSALKRVEDIVTVGYARRECETHTKSARDTQSGTPREAVMLSLKMHVLRTQHQTLRCGKTRGSSCRKIITQTRPSSPHKHPTNRLGCKQGEHKTKN